MGFFNFIFTFTSAVKAVYNDAAYSNALDVTTEFETFVWSSLEMYVKKTGCNDFACSDGSGNSD